MRKIIKKLGSQQGITILLSLFLFLICTVAGSVLITAGTAASGTISERAQLDQRYFSVMSAAELLRNQFDGKSVRVNLLADGKAASTEMTLDKGDNSLKNWIVGRSLYFVKSTYGLDVSSITGITVPDALEEEIYNLQAKEGDKELEKLRIKVTVTPENSNKGDRFTFTLENVNGDDKTFRVKMDYSASVLEETDARIVSWQMGKISLTD